MTAMAAVCGFVVLPNFAQAQGAWDMAGSQGRGRYDQRYDDRYYSRPFRNNLESLVRNAERSSNSFRQMIERREDWIEDLIDRRDDRWDRNDDWRNDRYRDDRSRDDRYRDDRYRDRSNLGQRDRFFDQLRPRVQRLDEAFERLRRDVERNSARSGRDEADRVIRAANEVDRIFPDQDYGWRYNSRYNRAERVPNYRNSNRRGQRISERWADLRRDINSIARAYNLPEVGRSRRYYW
jgi:hypothetical protein